MTDPSKALLVYLRRIGMGLRPDFLREAIRVMSELLMELEVSHQIGAERYERSDTRTTQRNGYREPAWETWMGEIDLHIPKLWQGSYYPSLLEPRRRAEQALLAVIQQAYIEGVSVRRFDDLLKALGLTGVDRSAVSRICQQLDEVVEQFRQRPLQAPYPYLWLDALYVKVRQNHRIVNQALVIGIGARETGKREIVGFAVGASEEQAFWLKFLRSLLARGLHGVQQVISDALEGLNAAIGLVFNGAVWQRGRVHCLRNLMAHVPQADKAMVAAAVRTIFAQPNRLAAGQQLQEEVQALWTRWPQAARGLTEAEEDVLAYMAVPHEHWAGVFPTYVLERLNS